MRAVFRHAGDGRPLLIAGFALILVDAAVQILGPAVFRVVLNRIQDDSRGFLQGGWRGPALGAVAIATTFLTAAYFAHTWTRRGAARWASNLRGDLYEHVQCLSVDFFHHSRMGDVAGRINQDIERLEATVWHALIVWWASALLAMAVGLIVWVDTTMALTAVGLLAIACIWTLVGLPRLRRRTRYVRDELGNTSGTVAELLGVNVLIKAFNVEGDAVRQVRLDTWRVREQSEALARAQHRYVDMLAFHLSFLAPFLLLFVGAWRSARGDLRIGDVVAIWAFWLRGSNALSQIVNYIPEVIAGVAASERAVELLDQRPTVLEGSGAPALDVVNGVVAFEHVSFGYPGRDRLVLDDVNLRIEAGRCLALVGRRAPGGRRSLNCSSASTTRRSGVSPSTTRTSVRSSNARCAPRSALCSRRTSS